MTSKLKLPNNSIAANVETKQNVYFVCVLPTKEPLTFLIFHEESLLNKPRKFSDAVLSLYYAILSLLLLFVLWYLSTIIGTCKDKEI